MQVTVLGAGYVGLVTGLGLATMGHDVAILDTNTERIAALERGETPFYEPGLDRQLSDCRRARSVHFGTPSDDAIRRASLILCCVGTPAAPDGRADLRAVWSAAETVANASRDALFVIKSTVSPGTGRRLRAHLHARGTPIRLASNPEFLREAHAVDDFATPDRIVIGSDDDRAFGLLRELYKPFWSDGVPILAMNQTRAELTKYAANAMLATRISFMNDMADLAAATGADLEAVRRGIAHDPRIGAFFLHAGPGYGGRCFPKDVSAILHTGRHLGVPLPVVEASAQTNTRARARSLDAVERLLNLRHGGDAPVTVAVWGMGFKAGTDDIRDSPSRDLVRALLRYPHVTIRVHDHYAYATVRRDYAEPIAAGRLAITGGWSPVEAATGADCLVIMTDDAQYKAPNFAKLGQVMRTRNVADLRALLDVDAVLAHGFRYIGTGRPPHL